MPRQTKMVQLKIFNSVVLKSAYLLAPESKRQAFYTIWIEISGSGFRVCKESGGMGKVWQRMAWEYSDLTEAQKLFTRRIREKTDPNRKSSRKYRLMHKV